MQSRNMLPTIELAGSNLQYYFYLSSSLNQMNEVLEKTDCVVVFGIQIMNIDSIKE